MELPRLPHTSSPHKHELAASLGYAGLGRTSSDTRGKARCARQPAVASEQHGVEGLGERHGHRVVCTEILTKLPDATQQWFMDYWVFAPICWARSTMLTETTSKSPALALSGTPTGPPPYSFGR